jgi:hypothetical protein
MMIHNGIAWGKVMQTWDQRPIALQFLPAMPVTDPAVGDDVKSSSSV